MELRWLTKKTYHPYAGNRSMGIKTKETTTLQYLDFDTWVDIPTVIEDNGPEEANLLLRQLTNGRG